MNEFWKKLVDYLQNDQNVFLALVVNHTKGSPGTTGAKMLVPEKGETFGTIGGGIMEYKLIERAKQILKQGNFEAEIQTLYHSHFVEGDKSGMICGGSQTNLYYLCRPQTEKETIQKVVSLIEKDNLGYLYVYPSRMDVEEKAVNLTHSTLKINQETEQWVYEEPLFNSRRIAIIGGGHCALALSRVMKQLDYEVWVFDTRHEVATLTKNTYARLHIVDDYQNAGAVIPLPKLTFVVVMTTDFLSDVRALLGVVSLPFPFIGVMGSSAKIAKIFQQLRQEGATETTLSRLYAPVGLPIGSHTPEEISISVAAQIIQVREALH